MLKKYLFIIFILTLFSCKKRSEIEQENKKNEIEYKKRIDEEERIKKIENIERIKNYKKNSDTINSKKIYNQLNDTIKKWIKFNYYFFKEYIEKRDILKLSKYIYFNSKKDKLIALMITRTYSKCYVNTDNIYYFIGEKFNDGWWYYFNGVGIIKREEYSNNKKVPLPYELLEEIGIIRILNRYASENDNYISDENFEKIKWEAERERYSIQDEKNN